MIAPPSAAGVHARLARSLARNDGPKTLPRKRMYNYSHDGLGSVRTLTDSSGDLENRYDYLPFGRQILSADADGIGSSWGYSGRPGSGVSFMLYYGYRWYMPELGRWGQRDPLREVGGINAYAFVGNSPVLYRDLLGLARLTKTYDFSSDVGWREWPNLPMGTQSVSTIQEVLMDLQGTVPPYHREGRDPCNCVEKLTLTAHSGSPGFLDFGDAQLDASSIAAMLEERNAAHLRKIEDLMRRETEFIHALGGYLCENADVDFVCCSAGRGAPGQLLRDYLESFLPPDAHVILYEGNVSFQWGTPTPEPAHPTRPTYEEYAAGHAPWESSVTGYYDDPVYYYGPP